MPEYPLNTKAAQQKSAEIASKFGNLECVPCAKAIAKALGPQVDAEIFKLRCSDASGIIQLPSRELLVSWTGQHIGIRVGEKVFDNLHHDGIWVASWSREFASATGAALTHYRKPIAAFFDTRFRWRAFAHFMSNRPQAE